MSIPAIQKAIQLEISSRKLFSNGEKPFLGEVFADASKYFSKHQLGKPISFGDFDLKQNVKSSIKPINMMASCIVLNLALIYQSSLMQARAVDQMQQTLSSATKKMQQRRSELENLIDSYLLSAFNTDGYFYSALEKFNSLSTADIALTSAYIDLQTNSCSIPSVSNGVTKLKKEDVGSVKVLAYYPKSSNIRDDVTTNAILDQGEQVRFNSSYDFLNCLDTKDNTFWFGSVETDTNMPVVVQVDIDFKTSSMPVSISRLEAELYGISPTQMLVKTSENSASSLNIFYEDFSNSTQVGTNTLLFVDKTREIASLRILLRKDTPDIISEKNNVKKYQYIFGFRNLFITKNTYDLDALYVSKAFSLPQEKFGDAYIDAISLEAEYIRPPGTDLEFYVAQDDGTAKWLDDFSWKKIVPITPTSSIEDVVRFDGTSSHSTMIKSNPGDNDLGLIPINSTSSSEMDRNPIDNLAPDASVYRLTRFDEEVISDTLKIEEGINTTRIFYLNRNESAISNGLEFWKDKIYTSSVKTTYGNINDGNGFFYGGDIGENGKSVYIETFLESQFFQNNIIKDFKKLDSNALYWDIKLFLNGSEIGHIEPGVDFKTIPWAFREGMNHIAMIVNMPYAGANGSVPYLGVLDLMSGDDIKSYGTIKLANWSYVDIFKLKYKETGSPYTFSIFNEEIVSRRKPTNNLRLSYKKATGLSPDGIRLRCDLTRTAEDPNVTPLLKSYKLRFAYGENDE